MFEQLQTANNKNELMLLDGGFCRWHLREDGQLTIYEILSQKPGTGRRILERLKRIPHATSILAKCPVHLSANNWYSHRGFHVEKMEYLPSGRKVLHWRMKLDTHHPTTRKYNRVEVIYCANGNKQLAEIAIDAGLEYGAQLPGYCYYQPYFVDQDWKHPDLIKYLAQIQQLMPYMATVKDIETWAGLDEALSWCEQIVPYVQELVIIPKVSGVIDHLPRTIQEKRVRLGYSVPTRYGGTTVAHAEFQGWPVHLLGGSPEVQLSLTRYLQVVSVDTNYMKKLARQFHGFWSPTPVQARNKHYPRLSEIGYPDGTMHDAFRMSCQNIVKAWQDHRQPDQKVYNQLLFSAAHFNNRYEGIKP